MQEMYKRISRKLLEKNGKESELLLLSRLKIGNTHWLFSLFLRKHTIEIEQTSSSLILKQLGPAIYQRERKKPKIDPVELYKGNLTLDQVLHVARVLTAAGKNTSKTFAGFVKCIIGTVQSFGSVTIDGLTCKEMTKQINEGEVPIPDK